MIDERLRMEICDVPGITPEEVDVVIGLIQKGEEEQAKDVLMDILSQWAGGLIEGIANEKASGAATPKA